MRRSTCKGWASSPAGTTPALQVGINQDWGSWFAYRVALLADTATGHQKPGTVLSCQGCAGKPCIMACPRLP